MLGLGDEIVEILTNLNSCLLSLGSLVDSSLQGRIYLGLPKVRLERGNQAEEEILVDREVRMVRRHPKLWQVSAEDGILQCPVEQVSHRELLEPWHLHLHDVCILEEEFALGYAFT